ncbi:hypothetical protein [Aneurinibacillus aneurinilyticus]|uniref:hypothetical protein n=1 Tax=Aneurinibacillus aneurinilyticus TaxID=1391 RepID=UPI0023F8687C|nr:hypothetical protein [Aneurinibacillus aneurinilyticus]MCI1694428.1 hypothetical protein [Aneurinibacillus aneurinilyticus]
MSLWVVERSFWSFYHFYLEKGAVPHLLSIHKVEERGCTRRRVPSSFSHKEETQPPGPDRQNIWVLRGRRQLPVDFAPGATRSTQ